MDFVEDERSRMSAEEEIRFFAGVLRVDHRIENEVVEIGEVVSEQGGFSDLPSTADNRDGEGRYHATQFFADQPHRRIR